MVNYPPLKREACEENPQDSVDQPEPVSALRSI